MISILRFIKQVKQFLYLAYSFSILLSYHQSFANLDITIESRKFLLYICNNSNSMLMKTLIGVKKKKRSPLPEKHSKSADHLQMANPCSAEASPHHEAATSVLIGRLQADLVPLSISSPITSRSVLTRQKRCSSLNRVAPLLP